MQIRGLVALLALLLALVPVAAGGEQVGASEHGDPLRGDQWGLDAVGIEQAWSRSRGDGAVVAVIDTGIALDHPDLADRFVRQRDGSVLGLDLVDGDEPQDTHGHGTLVAGVIAATADNAEGIAGVAPHARLLPIRILDGRGAGAGGDVGRAIRWAVDRGADVINLSIEAAPVKDGRRTGPAVPTDAVRYAADRGVVVIVAAGNTAGAASAYPDDTPALLVGAVDRGDRPAAFAEVGRLDAVVAPGVDVVSTWCRRTATGCDAADAPYGTAAGTSFAAPHVSGVAAMLAARGVPGEDIVRRIREATVDLGSEGPDEVYGAGRLDAAAALGGTRAAAASSDPAPDRATRSAPSSPPEPVPDPVPEADPASDPESEPGADAATQPPPPPADEADDQPQDQPVLEDATPIEPPAGPEPVARPGDAAGTGGDEFAAAHEDGPPAELDGQAAAARSGGDAASVHPLQAVAVVVLLTTMWVWSRAARRWELA